MENKSSNNSMIRKILSSMFLLLFVVGATAFGQAKIGYMNTQEVLNQIPERSEVQQTLNSFIQQKRQEVQQKTTSFQDSVAQLQQNQSAMSEQEVAQAEQRLSQMQESMRQFQQGVQQQIQQRRAELLQPIYDRMNKAIAAVAEEQNLDFVLNESTGNGDKIVYYASQQKLNITDEVLQKMNATSSEN